MSNFIVVDKKEKIRTTINRWTINFSQRTTIILVSHLNFLLEAFSFKPIPELLVAEKLDDSLLIDVIGEVVGKEDPRELITSKEEIVLVVLFGNMENRCSDSTDMSTVVANMQNDIDSILNLDDLKDCVTSLKEKT
ncbi:hypothetical protein Ahy_A10g049773 [Arachis hypogaea]|uniref:DUF223 domain-containing protein n=1 Tax=Arachis hypogaea TaxID=3818 RepID=A0A445B7V2_ARAHY|nr:hypothetical protein Ahy_A10g049773 [Arachis hypogaea]